MWAAARLKLSNLLGDEMFHRFPGRVSLHCCLLLPFQNVPNLSLFFSPLLSQLKSLYDEADSQEHQHGKEDLEQRSHLPPVGVGLVRGRRLIQPVRPPLHHPPAFRKIFRVVVCGPNLVTLDVGKLALDDVWQPAVFI